MSDKGPASPALRTSRSWPTVAGVAGMMLVATLLVFHRVSAAVRLGPEWDTYAFLANAAEFAGKGFGYTEPHRPPFMSFLTSLWFRVAPLSEAPIQWVDGILTLSGVLAVYLLLRRRVSFPLSLAGGLAFLGVTPVWEWLGMGYTDTPSVALSLWALHAAILATERDSRWYLALGPLFVLASLTRFTALIVGFPIAVWVLLRWAPFRHAKHVAGAVLTAAATYLPAGIYYMARMGDALFPFLFAFTLSEVVSTPGGEGAASADALHYVRNLPGFFANPEYTVLAILVIGVGLYALLYALFADGLRTSRPGPGAVAVAIAGAAVGVAAQFGGGLVVRQVAIPLAIVVVWRALAPREPAAEAGSRGRVAPAAALDAVMLAWLLAYFDFHGHQTIQIARYYIPMAVPVLYFVLLGWDLLAHRLGVLVRSVWPAKARSVAAEAAPVAIAAGVSLVLLFSTVSMAASPSPAPFIGIDAARDSALWVDEHRADSDPVVSDLWPHTSWFLRAEIPAMPLFTDSRAFSHQLDKSAAEFYLTVHPDRNYDAYEPAASFGVVEVIRRGDVRAAELPRILHLGTAWTNYIESLTGYAYYLDSTAGRYGFEGSAYLDAYTASELGGYDAVTVASYRWRDRGAGEDALRGHVEAGGSVIIDASQNLGGLAYAVTDTIMFDTVIRRGQLAPHAPIELSASFATRHPDVGSVSAAPWIDEGGGTWTGATYEARPGSPALETLATVGGRPLVQMQRLGEGRIYWISYNLAWHAFVYENDSEARLIRAVLDDAIASARASRSTASAP